MAFAILYVTHSNEKEAAHLTQQLLTKELIACANTFPMESAYWWQGAIQKTGELVSLYKTSLRMWEAVEAEIEAIHPYDVPCIMRLEVEANESYEKWIEESVG